ncbi:MAG: hypothetical protein INH34_09750 [Phycisphaerales bacterium]|jgi:hypothetical protein|nr:hypothetical protein [Phycisphaerales bacterium]
MRSCAIRIVLFALAGLAASCGGGGGGGADTGGAAANASPLPLSGPVQVVLDAAVGAPHTVQFDLAAAVLQRRDGSVTGDLLGGPRTVTFASPTGGARGFVLTGAPAGEYTHLRLLLTPGSGLLVRGDRTRAPVDAEPELAVPIAGALRHDGVAASWLVVGSLGGDELVDGGARALWRPQLAGRLDEATQTLCGLVPTSVDGVTLHAAWAGHGGGALRLVFAFDTVFSDRIDATIGTRNAFFAALTDADEVAVDGVLLRDGTVHARAVRSSPRRVEPRLHGTITANGGGGMRLRVDAEELFDRLRHLPAPYDVDVALAGAQVRELGHLARLGAAACEPGRRAVVRIAARRWQAGSVQLDGDEVELTPPAGAPLRLEWHGRVVGVDVVAGSLLVERAPDVPLVVAGAALASATVVCPEGCSILRRELLGQGQYAIGLGGIVAGGDRVWWRGEVVGPGTVRATEVRVRTQ